MNLHPNKMKYKCSLCGKLFSQLKIDNENFVKWNKKRREKEKKEVDKEFSRARNKEYYTKNKEEFKKHNKEYYQKHKQKVVVEKGNYYEQHRDTIVQQKRDYRAALSGQQKKEENEKRKARRYKNIDATRTEGRINHWKQQQKALAIEIYENRLLEGYKGILSNFLPTWHIVNY